MLFFDQPVGTGFSFTESKEGYATNVTQSSAQLYTGLVQFFKMFPWLHNNEFYVAGESYAGKYIPCLGNEITERNKKESFKINLKVNN
jgi:vitellogenic carboxypeptidase-like protein